MSSPPMPQSPWQCLLKCCQGTNARLDRMLQRGYGPAASDWTENVFFGPAPAGSKVVQIAQQNPSRRLLVFGAGLNTQGFVSTVPDLNLPNWGTQLYYFPQIIDYETWGPICCAAWYLVQPSSSTGVTVWELFLRQERIGQTGT